MKPTTTTRFVQLQVVLALMTMALVPARVLGRSFLQSSAFVRPCVSTTRKEGPLLISRKPAPFRTLAFSSRLNAGPPSGGSGGRNINPVNQGHPSNNNNKPKFKPRRFSSDANDNWVIPKSIDIPVEKIDLSFSRSSGSGGQNVNKVSTKVELRFQVLEAEWIPLEVRQRLYEQQRGRINKKGLISIQSQEFRTQEKNRKHAVSKLQGMVLQAWPRPKERKMRKGVSKAAKERNREYKKRRSDVKQTRRQVGSNDW